MNTESASMKQGFLVVAAITRLILARWTSAGKGWCEAGGTCRGMQDWPVAGWNVRVLD